MGDTEANDMEKNMEKALHLMVDRMRKEGMRSGRDATRFSRKFGVFAAVRSFWQE
jgi:hypothetical protein